MNCLNRQGNRTKAAAWLLCFVISSCAARKQQEADMRQDAVAEKEAMTEPAVVHSSSGGTDTMPLGSAYLSAFAELKAMLASKNPDFKRAVFVTENAYYRQELSYERYLLAVQKLTGVCNAWLKANRLHGYDAADSMNVLKNYAIYTVLKDTVYLLDSIPLTFPYTYDFEDFTGAKDWSKMFVTKLLQQGNGNCHSLPYLYKILADEIGASAWLALAPNHIYIKNRCKKIGWYNTELTSGQFPTDAWIKASGYISLDAIRGGIYMDTLGPAQAVALCVYDLAKGYEKQTGNYDDGFILNCCDLVLKYYPHHINAVILKAETLKKQFEALAKARDEKAKALFDEMEGWYVKAALLGYYEMPADMYLGWLASLKNEREKYLNPKTNTIFK